MELAAWALPVSVWVLAGAVWGRHMRRVRNRMDRGGRWIWRLVLPGTRWNPVLEVAFLAGLLATLMFVDTKMAFSAEHRAYYLVTAAGGLMLALGATLQSGIDTSRVEIDALDEALVRLLSPPDEQVLYLRRRQRGRDLDAMRMVEACCRWLGSVPVWAAQGVLGLDQATALRDLDVRLSALRSTHYPGRGSEQDVRNNPAWEEIRRLAAVAHERLSGVKYPDGSDVS